jgi:hypothetical protein
VKWIECSICGDWFWEKYAKYKEEKILCIFCYNDPQSYERRLKERKNYDWKRIDDLIKFQEKRR